MTIGGFATLMNLNISKYRQMAPKENYMYLVDLEKETIEECSILGKKTGYTIILVGNEIFGLPSEDETHYLCYTLEEANAILYSGWFIPQ